MEPQEAVWRAIDSNPHVINSACIRGARALQQVLSYQGKNPGRLVAVSVLAGNDQAFHLMQEQIPTDVWPPEAWTVGVHPGNEGRTDVPTRWVPGGGWHGHLVVVSNGVMLDPTAGQFDRPAKGIEIPGSMALEWGESGAGWGDDQQFIIYTPAAVRMPTDAPDWKPSRWQPLAAEAIRLLRAAE